MAITWTSTWTNPASGEYEQVASLYTAYDTAGGTTDGEWFSTAGIDFVSVEFDESNTAGITVTGYNGSTTLANTAHGTVIGSEITSDGFTNYDRHQIPNFMKVRITTATSGTVDVRVKVHGRGLGNRA